jgi:hypothetical protein
MSRRIEVSLVDDVDPSIPAIGTFQFAWGGYRYEIDLSDKHKDQLDAALTPFVEKARRVGRLHGGNANPRMLRAPGHAPAAPHAVSPAAPRESQITFVDSTGREENKQIREYFKRKGVEVPQRGRIPRHLREEWDNHKRAIANRSTSMPAAQPEPAAPQSTPTRRPSRATSRGSR